jgi:hypothetical protein
MLCWHVEARTLKVRGSGHLIAGNARNTQFQIIGGPYFVSWSNKRVQRCHSIKNDEADLH